MHQLIPPPSPTNPHHSSLIQTFLQAQLSRRSVICSLEYLIDIFDSPDDEVHVFDLLFSDVLDRHAPIT